MSTENLKIIINRLVNHLKRDVLIQKQLHDLREQLKVDRVVLYYFYRHWQGQVIAESLSSSELSILGSTGAEECFAQEYAILYEAGRIREITDIETEPIHECHREFLRGINVRANLVVPILNTKGLWGLLVAHQCCNSHHWKTSDIELMRTEAEKMAISPAIQDR